MLHIYPTPYYLHHSDKSLRKTAQIIVRPFSNRSEFQYFQKISKSVANLEKLPQITKLRDLNSFPMAYHMHYSDLWFEKYVENTFQTYFHSFSIFKINLKQLII
jgi:hypothetical protein